jgi:hypothetical protein
VRRRECVGTPPERHAPPLARLRDGLLAAGFGVHVC